MDRTDLPPPLYLPSFYDRRPRDVVAFDEVSRAVVAGLDGWHLCRGYIDRRQDDVLWSQQTAAGVETFLSAGRAAGAVVLAVDTATIDMLLEDATRYEGALRALTYGGSDEHSELAEELATLAADVTGGPEELWRWRMRWTANGESVFFESAERRARFLATRLGQAQRLVAETALFDHESDRLIKELNATFF